MKIIIKRQISILSIISLISISVSTNGQTISYKLTLTESSPSSCIKLSEELKNNNSALNQAINKKNSCLAGKILLTNQKLLEQGLECPKVQIQNYFDRGKCRIVGDHMHTSAEKIAELVKANKECEAGEALIMDQDFLKQYPKCNKQSK